MNNSSITSMKSWFYPVNGKSKHMICLNYGEWDECCSHCYEAWCKYSKRESWAYYNTSQPSIINCPLWKENVGWPRCINLDNKKGVCHNKGGICEIAKNHNSSNSSKNEEEKL